PRTERLAKAIVGGLEIKGAPLNRRPYRAAAFSVLKAADIPSILLEIGFLSSDRDFKNVVDPLWRRKMAEGIRDGIQAWILADEAIRRVVRQ
ncbi:N-acetylmuramoyl-L-alanine amidase family protein, partial [Lentibacter algarum]